MQANSEVFAQLTHLKLHFLFSFFFFCEKVNINLPLIRWNSFTQSLQKIQKLCVKVRLFQHVCLRVSMAQRTAVGFPVFSTGQCNPTHTGLVLPHLS